MSNITLQPSVGFIDAQPYHEIVPQSYSFQSVTSPAWHPDGRRIVAGVLDSIIIWDITNGEEEAKPLQHGSLLHDVVLARDGKKIVSVSANGRIKVWDVESQQLLKDWFFPTPRPSITVSPDGQLVAAGGDSVIIYNMEGRIKRYIAPERPAFYVSFSSGGDKLAFSTSRGINIYDIDCRMLVHVISCDEERGPLHWSHDGNMIFSSGYSRYLISCWHVNSGGQIGHSWPGGNPDQDVIFLSLSPNGSILASIATRRFLAGGHYTIRFWDTRGNPIGQPLRGKGRCTGLCFSSSGESVATTTSTGIYFWRVPKSESNFNAKVSPAPDLTQYIFKGDDQCIAGGAFGDVYRCWCDDGVRKEVAVKALRFSFANRDATDNGTRKMLRRELGIWRRLDHVNVVPFLGIAYGFGMSGAMSLTSLWMPNGSLHHFLEKHNDELGLDQRLQFLLDTANGLHYLHSLSVVHGDLNCNNILLDEDYTARIADFGYASLVGNIPEALAYLQRSTVRPGALRWAAPEQIDPEKVFDRTIKSDIYSFGCVSLQVLSGKQPWSEVRQDAAVVLCLARGQKPSRPKCQQLQDSHWDLIQQCWSLTAEERPPMDVILISIRHFFINCPRSWPLQGLVARRLSQSSSPAHESSPSPSVEPEAPRDGSGMHDKRAMGETRKGELARSEASTPEMFAERARKRLRFA